MKVIVIQKNKFYLMNASTRYSIAKRIKIYSCYNVNNSCKKCYLNTLCCSLNLSVRNAFLRLIIKKVY